MENAKKIPLALRPAVWAFSALIVFLCVAVMALLIVALTKVDISNQDIIRIKTECAEAFMGVEVIRSDSGRIIDAQCNPESEWRF